MRDEARGPAVPRDLTVRPVTGARWPDLEALFGPRGACAGCWCMFWRRPRAEWIRGKGMGNRRAFKMVVEAGPPPGLLAYSGARPVGWCSVAPRSKFPGLQRSRILQQVDAKPVWSITCLFVARDFRHQGVSARLLDAAARYAASRGARIVEGYPVEPRAGAVADAFAWTGLASAYRRAGFAEAARRSPTRPIMRRNLRASRRRRNRAPASASSRQ